MKNVILIVCLFVSLISIGQDSPDKWYHTAKLDLLMPTKTTYRYDITASGIGEVELDSKLAVRLLYSYNLWVIKDKFSAGLLAGLHFFTNPQLSLLDLGGEFRITILKDLDVNLLCQMVYLQPIDGTKTNGGIAVDVALEAPVYGFGGKYVIVGFGLGSGLFDMNGTGYESSKVQGDQFADIVEYNSFNLNVGLMF